MPSWEIFDRQTQEYRDSVLPPQVKARVAVEQASTFGWERYVGSSGRVIGMHTFGASAPLKALQEKFGFEPDQRRDVRQGAPGQAVSNGLEEGSSSPLGATPSAEGVNFSVFSRHATGVELLLFDDADDTKPARVVRLDPSVNRTYHYWHVFVPDVRPGQLYAYRVDGPVRSAERPALRSHQGAPGSLRAGRRGSAGLRS